MGETPCSYLCSLWVAVGVEQHLPDSTKSPPLPPAPCFGEECGLILGRTPQPLDSCSCPAQVSPPSSGRLTVAASCLCPSETPSWSHVTVTVTGPELPPEDRDLQGRADFWLGTLHSEAPVSFMHFPESKGLTQPAQVRTSVGCQPGNPEVLTSHLTDESQGIH